MIKTRSYTIHKQSSSRLICANLTVKILAYSLVHPIVFRMFFHEFS